jgi:outer membrane protein OmpA-like peptidoglycan-associated protein/tetratricopeptide (TPR) repeat protein
MINIQNIMKKIVLIFLLLTMVPVMAFSASLGERRADALYEKEFYHDAIKKYTKLTEKGKINLNIATRLGHSYRKVNDFSNAAAWYAQAVNIENVDPEVYYYYAEMLRAINQHQEALQWYQKYAGLNPGDTRAAEILKDPDYINTIDITSLYGVLTPIETGFNRSEFGLAFMNQQQVVFSSVRESESVMNHKNKRENRPFYNLYTADIVNWKLENIRPFDGGINSHLHEGPVVFTSDGKEMYFTRNSHTARSRFRSNPVNHLMIYRAEFDGNQWTNVQPLPFNSSSYSCGHPAISADGKKLYFVSDMPGGLGETDIYVVEKTENGWSTPQNLGNTINTAGRELFPFIAPNGALYFSSDGHVSLGSLDVFVAEWKNNMFQKPLNLGYPVNSSADDFGFVLAQDMVNGFFSSNRQNSAQDDFYHFEIKKRPDIYVLDFIIKDSGSKETINNVLVSFSGNNLPEILSDQNGGINLEVDGNKSYAVRLQKEGYLSFETTISARIKPRGQTIEKEIIEIEKITEDISFELNIYFDSGSSVIRQESLVDLDGKALKFLEDNPGISVELGAHTDSRGNPNTNLLLSQQRAQSAVDYLVTKGIHPDRLLAKGYGDTQIRNHCLKGVDCSDEEHQQNRRVEIRVTSF